jgi:glyoxylase-like metal-dependent hydrolase (beta-lactamase superfamily II)
MQTRRLTWYLTQLTRLGAVNCYLVQEDDGLTLVDTNLPGSTRLILEAAKHLRGPIQRIVLTHSHMDHIGSLDALHRALPRADVLIGRRASRLLKEDLSLDAGEPQVAVRGRFPGAKTQPSHLLNEGDMVCHLRAIATPGHTPGHLSFLDERDGTLIAGDALVGFGGLRAAGDAPWYFPLVNMATWDARTALESVRKLMLLEVEGVATGHGPAIIGAVARNAIANASLNAEKRLGRMAERSDASSGTAESPVNASEKDVVLEARDEHRKAAHL